MPKMKTTVTGSDALEMRLRRDLTQEPFWARVGITQSGGSRYESGRSIPRPVQMLLLIAYGTPAQRKFVLDALGEQKA